MIKVVSFNVNSVRARQDILLEFLSTHSPDIIGLQETKVQDEEFPFEPYADLGYELIVFGQKTHYGVALLSKKNPLDFQRGFEPGSDDTQKRFVCASFETSDGGKLHVLNGYFPQGESIKHPTKFPDKVNFYQNLNRFTDEKYSKEDRVIIMGDFNISPEDKDVGIGEVNAKRWLRDGKCSFLPEEREIYQNLLKKGFYDTYRKFFPNEDKIYSWFDFRSGGFSAEPKRGLRIDHILVTKPLLEICSGASIDYETRSKAKPSDHCPVFAEFAIDW